MKRLTNLCLSILMCGFGTSFVHATTFKLISQSFDIEGVYDFRYDTGNPFDPYGYEYDSFNLTSSLPISDSIVGYGRYSEASVSCEAANYTVDIVSHYSNAYQTGNGTQAAAISEWVFRYIGTPDTFDLTIPFTLNGENDLCNLSILIKEGSTPIFSQTYSNAISTTLNVPITFSKNIDYSVILSADCALTLPPDMTVNTSGSITTDLSFAQVPEPATVILLSLGGLSLLRKRK